MSSIQAGEKGNQEDSSSADVILRAAPRKAWKVAAEYAWNDETLDFLLGQWERHGEGWDLFSVLYTAILPPDFLEANHTPPHKPLLFAFRALYEKHYKERVSEEEILTLETQRKLWEAFPISIVPLTAWPVIPFSSGTLTGLMNLMWTRSLKPHRHSPANPYVAGEKRRMGFSNQHSTAFGALLSHPNLEDREVFKWMTAAANKNSPHRDTKRLWKILESAMSNPNISKRTLRTALRIGFRAVPAEGEAGHAHLHHVSRRLGRRALSLPVIDEKILASLHDAGLITAEDFEGYVEELDMPYEEYDDDEPIFKKPRRGDTHSLKAEELSSAVAVLAVDKRDYIQLAGLTAGFPLPQIIWDAFLAKVERDRFSLSMAMGHLMVTVLAQVPPPPKEVVLKTLDLVSAVEPVSAMLHYYGYAMAELRSQAAADGLQVGDIPAEWLREIYS